MTSKIFSKTFKPVRLFIFCKKQDRISRYLVFFRPYDGVL
jgi:hypothetical protein